MGSEMKSFFLNAAKEAKTSSHLETIRNYDQDFS